MCQIRDVPIKGSYQNHHFGHHADFCMVGVINAINGEADCATVASCCGHSIPGHVPYITVILPAHRINEVKEFVVELLGWDVISVSMWKGFPEDSLTQLGARWLEGKVYVGYYNMTDEYNSDTDFCYTWSDDEIQVA